MLVGIVRMILRTSKSEKGRWELSEVEVQILFEDYNRILKMKEHLTFFSKFNVLCIEDRVVADFSNLGKEVALKDSAFWWVACLTNKVL